MCICMFRSQRKCKLRVLSWEDDFPTRGGCHLTISIFGRCICCEYQSLPASWLTQDRPRLFIAADEFVHTDFRGCVPFFSQAAGDLNETLSLTVIEKNPLLHIICEYTIFKCRSHTREDRRQDNTSKRETQANNTRRDCTEANHTQNVRGNISLASRLSSMMAWNYLQFTASGAYFTYEHTSENVRINIRTYN